METQYNNPWPGLASYKDPSDNIQEANYKFCGRLSETYELLQLIDSRSVVTLYGSTGIGKTSLLCAGVFPILRQRKDNLSSEGKNVFHPIYVRLSSPTQFKEESDSTIRNLSFAEILIKCIEHDLDIESSPIAPNKIKYEEQCVLWNYFHSHLFRVKGDRQSQVTPVIVLDQFEELFNYSENDAKIRLFLQQLYVLAEDRLSWNEYKGYHKATFRLVISLREDRLFYLEDYIESLKLQLFKENRYRLLPLSYEKAKQVVTVPGRNIITRGEEEEIAHIIIEQARNKNRGDINTLMLSLICSLIYEKSAPTHRFTVENVKVLSRDVLKQFYRDVTQQLPITERLTMENLLVKEGRREQVNLKVFLENVPHGEYLLKQNENSILRVNNNKVEVIHDQLAILMEEMKPTTSYEIRKHQLRRLGNIFLLTVLLGLMILVIWNLPRVLWRDTIPLEGEIRNVTIENKGYARPLSVPSGVLNLASNVDVEYNTFQMNPDICEVHLGDSCSIDYFAFADCPNLRTIYFDGKGISLKDNAFANCNQVETIIVSDSCDFFHIGTQDGLPALSRIVIRGNNPNFISFGNTLLIKQKAGYNNYFWKVICSVGKMQRYHHEDSSSDLHIAGKVILPQLQDSIATDSLQYEYGQIIDIRNKFVPDTGTYCVLTCSDLSLHTNPVTVNNYPKLVGIDFPHIVHINNRAFYNNDNLISIQLPQVYDIGREAFSNCNELKNVFLPKTSVIENNAFEQCKNLKEIQLPLLLEADTSVFNNCQSLQKVIAPALKAIRTSAFGQCGLQNVEFPSVEVVEQGAFYGCSRLKRLSLPSLITSEIGCTLYDSLEEIIVPTKTAKEIVDKLNSIDNGLWRMNFYKIAETKGKLSTIRKVDAPNIIRFADCDTLDFNDFSNRACSNLILSKRVKAIESKYKGIPHKEMSVELGNPTYFSFKNVVYSKKGIEMHAEGVEHAFFMNYGIGERKYNYDAPLSHNLKSIYLHFPQKNNVRVNIERTYLADNGTHFRNDSSFLKTVTLRIPFGYKKYCENFPEYQLFGNIEEISRWETMMISVEWEITYRIWTMFKKGPATIYGAIILFVCSLLFNISGYVVLFHHKKRLVLPVLLIQLTTMLFTAVLFYTIQFNYNGLIVGTIAIIPTMSLICEIFLLFVPWFVFIANCRDTFIFHIKQFHESCFGFKKRKANN